MHLTIPEQRQFTTESERRVPGLCNYTNMYTVNRRKLRSATQLYAENNEAIIIEKNKYELLKM